MTAKVLENFMIVKRPLAHQEKLSLTSTTDLFKGKNECNTTQHSPTVGYKILNKVAIVFNKCQ